MPRILVTPAVFFQKPGPYFDVLEAAGFDIVYPPAGDLPLHRSEVFLPLLAGIDATLASIEPYTEEIFEGSRLRAVARVGVGYDAVDVPSASRHGVAVSITPGTNEHSVAEQAFALIFAVFRDVAARDQAVRAGKWPRQSLRRLAGSTLGLVGLGRIGKAMAPRAQGLGLSVLAYDPYADKDFAARNNVRLCTFEELLAASDIVSLHMPCTPETTHLINARTLKLMKPNSVLVNTSRGGLIDETALEEALRSGHLFGAGLDVFAEEPPPVDHPLLRLPRVVAAPHMGGLDQEALDAMGKLAAECLVNLLNDRPCGTGCLLNPEVLQAARK